MLWGGGGQGVTWEQEFGIDDPDWRGRWRWRECFCYWRLYVPPTLRRWKMPRMSLLAPCLLWRWEPTHPAASFPGAVCYCGAQSLPRPLWWSVMVPVPRGLSPITGGLFIPHLGLEPLPSGSGGSSTHVIWWGELPHQGPSGALSLTWTQLLPSSLFFCQKKSKKQNQTTGKCFSKYYTYNFSEKSRVWKT